MKNTPFSEEELEEYGGLKTGGETDITYRVRDDGDFVALFDASGNDFLAGLRIEDIEKIHGDMG